MQWHCARVLHSNGAQFTDDHQQPHPREYGGAVGWWVVVVYIRTLMTEQPLNPDPDAAKPGPEAFDAS